MIPQVWYPWWCWCHRPWSLRNRLGKNLMSLLGMKSYTTLTWHRPWKGTMSRGNPIELQSPPLFRGYVTLKLRSFDSFLWDGHMQFFTKRVDSIGLSFENVTKPVERVNLCELCLEFFVFAQGSRVHLLGFFSSQLVAGMSMNISLFMSESIKPYPICHSLVKFVHRFAREIVGSRVLPQCVCGCAPLQNHRFPFYGLHPWNLTWNLKRSPWKGRFLLETIIFRFHVKFRGSMIYFAPSLRYLCDKLWQVFGLGVGLALHVYVSVPRVDCKNTWLSCFTQRGEQLPHDISFIAYTTISRTINKVVFFGVFCWIH